MPMRMSMETRRRMLESAIERQLLAEKKELWRQALVATIRCSNNYPCARLIADKAIKDYEEAFREQAHEASETSPG